MAAGTAPAVYTIELVCMDGTVITHIPFWYLVSNNETVADLAYDMECGKIPGVNAARRDGINLFIEKFQLVCGHCRMAPDDYVLDYFRTTDHNLDPSALPLRITLVKVPVDEATRSRIRSEFRGMGILLRRATPPFCGDP